jgi:hypothetical protein
MIEASPCDAPHFHRAFYDAIHLLPSGRRPILPKADLETPWRTATWSAEPQEGRWHLRFHQSTRPVFRGYPDREAGVEAHRQDRNQLQVLLTDLRTVAAAD